MDILEASQSPRCHSDESISVGFSSAVSDFRSALLQDGIDDSQICSSLPELKTAIEDIEEQQSKRKSLRNIGRIRPLIHGLEAYSTIIEIFVNVKPDFLAFLWGPIKLCVQISSNLDKAFDALLNTYASLGASLPVISAIDNLFTSNPLVQDTLIHVYKDVLTFHYRALQFFKKRGWQIALNLAIRPFAGLFNDLISNLERSKQLLYSTTQVSGKIAAETEGFRRRFKRQSALP